MNTRSISYVGEDIFIGIDVHKKSYTVSAVCNDKLLKTCRMPADPAQTVKFIKKHFSEARVKTCYEAGFSGFGLHRAFEKAGIDNLVVHAAAVEVSSRDRVKTDKRDSKKLAFHLANNRLISVRVPSEAEELSRLISRTREQLVNSISRLRIQIRMKLHQFGLMDPNDDRVLKRRTVEDIINKGLPKELDLGVRALLSSWESMLAQQRKLDKVISEQAKEDPIQLIWRSIPGMGITSTRVLADELGDTSQFPNERCLFSFTGLTPGEFSSGDKVYRGNISRQGNGRLRKILVEAAWRAIRKDEALREDFQRIAARRGKKRAIVAIARKLVGRARAVFRTSTQYELGYRTAA